MKQLNVQQQNARMEELLRRQAIYWRHAWPPALLAFATERGVDPANSIVVELDIDFPGMPRLFGVLLTQTERFIKFEIDTDEHHWVVVEVETWSDVTERQNLSRHNRGIGVGEGALAIKVLRELNETGGSDG
jgi:hypothetical protein